MRIREIALAIALAACVHDSSPDTRGLSAEKMARSGLGAWIVMEIDSSIYVGELIAISDTKLYILRDDKFGYVKLDGIQKATVWLYDVAIEGLTGWRVLGSLSTLTYGFFFILSLPIWLVTSAGVINAEIDASKLEYPQTSWNERALGAVSAGIAARHHQNGSDLPAARCQASGRAIGARRGIATRRGCAERRRSATTARREPRGRGRPRCALAGAAWRA